MAESKAIRVIMRIVVLTLGLLIGVVSCTIANPPVTSAPFATPTAPTSAPTPVIPPATKSTPTVVAGKENKVVSSEILIEYRRSGGFAGLSDHLTIYGDGAAKLARKGKDCKLALDPSDVTSLQKLLDDAQFSKLHRTYSPSRQGADFFTYVLTHKGHTVQAMDTAVPGSLYPVLNFLNQTVVRC